MQFVPSIFSKLLESINRRAFQSMVEACDANAYDKRFRSWDHLVALIYAQLSGTTSLRDLEVSWNAHRQHHYHLGTGRLARSTLADANSRRPPAVFTELFGRLVAALDRITRRQGEAMLRLIDSTPIPLGPLCGWALSNGRIRGLKLHLVYDPGTDTPRLLDITDANVNDAQVGRTVTIEPGATYVFDKGYCHYGWWTEIAEAGALFVTRPKTNMKLAELEERRLTVTQGDGFRVLADHRVRLASKGDSKLPVPLRRLRVEREDGKIITLITNDMQRTAGAIAALYKARWQIELLFRWLKQHLKIRKFLGNNDNAIRLQIIAAMIAYVLIRLAARRHHVTMPILRFLDLVTRCLFQRRDIANIEAPPPVNPCRPKDRCLPGQLAFHYA